MKKLMVTAVGKDTPGIVAAFTRVLQHNGCNIEDTSMTMLEDIFTMLYIVNVPPPMTKDDLEAKLMEVLKVYNLQLSILPIETEQQVVTTKGSPWMMSICGKDQTGIMYHVTQYLASHDINIYHLSSKRVTRPSGETLFLMALEVDVPQTVSEDQLDADLNQLAAETGLEVHAEPLEVYTL